MSGYTQNNVHVCACTYLDCLDSPQWLWDKLVILVESISINITLIYLNNYPFSFFLNECIYRSNHSWKMFQYLPMHTLLISVCVSVPTDELSPAAPIPAGPRTETINTPPLTTPPTAPSSLLLQMNL